MTLELLTFIITVGGASFGVMGFIIFCAVTFGSWKEKMRNVDNLEKSIKGLETSVAKIDVTLELFKQNSNPLLQTRSPLNLSDIGERYYTELGLQNTIEQHWDTITKQLLTSLSFDNLYDVQVQCISYAEDNIEKVLTADEINKIKDHAFKTGTPFDNYKTLIGILIRNKVFNQKHINLDDIDNYDPAKNK